jgi:DNA-binding MarR family transcriptional regulator
VDNFGPDGEPIAKDASHFAGRTGRDASSPRRPRLCAVTEVSETWSWREAPLLQIALRESDAGRDAQFEDLAEESGLDQRVVWQTMKRLHDAGYVEAYFAAADSGYVHEVTERTRRELGSWPSPESLLDQLVQAFNEAAEQETEPERKSRLRGVAEGLGGAGRTVALDLLSALIRQQAGLP